MGYIKECKKLINRMDEYEKHKARLYIQTALCSQEIQEFVKLFNDLKKKDIDDEMLDIVEKIIIHAKTIYEIDTYVEPFDDITYDRMLNKFKKFRDEPFANTIGKADAHYIYDDLSGTLDKTHYVMNKEKTDDRDSIEDYLSSLPSIKELHVFVDDKKDGVSLTGNMVLDGDEYYPESSISRGNKSYGEGTNVSVITNGMRFPHTKGLKKILGFLPKKLGVQFEMLVSDNQCKAFGKYIGKKYSNNRAAAAGLMRRILFASKKEQKELRKFVSLVPVGFNIPDEIKDFDWEEIYIEICKVFTVGEIEMSYDSYTGSKLDILKWFKKVAKERIDQRDKLNHAIDGLVLTVTDNKLIKKLGRKNNINQWQVAYKFPEKGKKTKIIGYEITTGNFGYKEMLLLVEPVELNGTIQGKAQVHSIDKFKRMDPHIGDEIILKLSGDVIPYGYKDETCKTGKGDKIKFPKRCECGEKLVEENNKYRCPSATCPYRVIGSMTTFFTELNAKGIGEKTCQKLHEELGINSPIDILKLKADDFKKLSGFKDKLAKSCMDTIYDIVNKPRAVESIISALGIDSFRTSTARKLLNTVSLDELINLIDEGNELKLIQLIRKADGIDENAEKIAKGLIYHIDDLKELLSLMTIKETVHYDKVALVTGFRPKENEIEIINSKGYDVKDSGTKCDILIIKDNDHAKGKKYDYAIKHNIPIVTLSEIVSEN